MNVIRNYQQNALQMKDFITRSDIMDVYMHNKYTATI